MRLYQEVGGQLREAIVSGQYSLGDRLPPERDIAENFSVSRSVVREALIMLELEKLVEVRKGSGVYVVNVPAMPANGESAVTADCGYGPFELLQARQLLESEVAAFAAMQATKPISSKCVTLSSRKKPHWQPELWMKVPTSCFIICWRNQRKIACWPIWLLRPGKRARPALCGKSLTVTPLILATGGSGWKITRKSYKRCYAVTAKQPSKPCGSIWKM